MVTTGWPPLICREFECIIVNIVVNSSVNKIYIVVVVIVVGE